MKKVMIGILILIPVLILLIVAAVSNILSLAAWIAVDDLTLIDKGTKMVAESLTVEFPSDQQTHNFYDYIKVEIKPERANRYSIEWRISGKVECMDEDYEAKYEYYLEHKSDPNLPEVKPPAMLVDDRGKEVESNTSGKFVISSYCRFNVIVQAESVSKTLAVIVEGYDVESITIVDVAENANNEIKVGESKRVDAKFTPLSSIVTKMHWQSSNPSVASVDENGVITAHSAGNANITVEANKHTDLNAFVTSETYTVTVKENVSKYGNSINTAKTSFTLDKDLGINKADVIGSEGCTIDGNRVDMTSGVATIVTTKGTLTINASTEGAISIAHSDLFSVDNGYVFAVSDLTLKLSAVWTDVLQEGVPEDVVWTSSDSDIATVSDGTVKAVSSGLVRITATKDGASVSLWLNVQIKVVSMQLRTSNDYFAVGLARETVFASDKYADISEDNSKIANSVLLEIVGAPIRGEDEDVQSYEIRRKVFYAAYEFKIGNGSQYAVLGGEYGNELTFIPSALRGKDRQTVTVHVSAKYPKYKNSFTQDSVNINVVYGVEVSNIEELRQASADQKEYVYEDSNLIDRELVFEHVNKTGGRNDRYRVYNYERSHSMYAISFAEDVAMETDENGDPITIGWKEGVYVYGNIYGNNKKFYAASQQLTSYSPMFIVSWSGVTISNINIRANGINDSGTISDDETSGFTGQCIYVSNEDNAYKWRLTDVRVEYCILENTRRAIELNNCDTTIEGSIMRNMSNVAIFAMTTMRSYQEDDGIWTTFPYYNKINMTNDVFSDCLASIAYLPSETFTYMPKTANVSEYFIDYSDENVSSGVGRFVRGDLKANERYYLDNFAAHGVVSAVNQVGFIDIYNWQNIKSANLVGDLDNAILNNVITAASGSLLEVNETFAPALYTNTEAEETYFHMGFLLSGLSMSNSIFGEHSYYQINLEDKRFGAPIRTLNMPHRCKGDIFGSTAEEFLSSCDFMYYSYSSNSDITPYSTYEVNSLMIKHLHGEE